MNILENIQPAEAFPAGEYLRDEIEERGWTVSEFAEIIDRPLQAVSEILNGRKEITVATAAEIAAATDTLPETWLHLQETYNLWKLKKEGAASKLDNVARRARLAAIVPMPELKKRGLVPSTDIDAQEQAVMRLLRIRSFEDSPNLPIAARRTDEGAPLSPAQVAWLSCARITAEDLPTKEYNLDKLVALASNLTRIVTHPGKISNLPAILADCGVRLIYVEAFKNSKIDGATWSDSRGPVVAMSARIQGLDSVIFTLLHEIAHIVLGHNQDGITIDTEVDTALVNGREKNANDLASSWAISDPISISNPISRSKVVSLANSMGVHPAIVVGRLHHMGLLDWKHLNQLIPKVRHLVSEWPTCSSMYVLQP